MSIWNKVLLGFIFVTGIVAFVLGLRDLKVHKVWRERAREREASLEDAAKTRQRLIYGQIRGGEVLEAGIRQMETRLAALAFGRGRVWSNCAPKQIQGAGETARIVVTTSLPDPNGIGVGEILHIFESDIVLVVDPAQRPANIEGMDDAVPGPSGEPAQPAAGATRGRYLGLFTVVGTAGSDVELQFAPAWSPNAAEFQAVAESVRSRRTWVLRETLPSDRPEDLANLTEDELRGLFPPETVEEYISDPTGRTLRDYGEFFAEAYRIRSRQLADIAEKTAHNAALEEAVDLAVEQENFNRREIDRLRQAIEVAETQRDLVVAHKTRLEAKIAEVGADISKTLQENRALASEIARIQYQAITGVEQRVQATMQ